eukprot:304515_1
MHSQQCSGSWFFLLNNQKENTTMQCLPIYNISDSTTELSHDCGAIEDDKSIDCDVVLTNIHIGTKMNIDSIKPSYKTINSPKSIENSKNDDIYLYLATMDITSHYLPEKDNIFMKTKLPDELGVNRMDNNVHKDTSTFLHDGWWVSQDYYCDNTIDFEYDPTFVYYGVEI